VGSASYAGSPIKVAGMTGVTAATTGPATSCIVNSATVAYCWGADDVGELGSGPNVPTGGNANSVTPVPVVATNTPSSG
jgi:hypothetical protein